MSEPVIPFLANIAQILSGVAIIAAAILALVTIVANRRSGRQQAVFSYLKRLDDAAQTVVWAADLWLLRGVETAEDGKAKIRALTSADRGRLFGILNFYEELSAVYMNHLLDESLFREMLAPVLVGYWRQAHWLINYLRDPSASGRPDMALWRCWEAVHEKMLREGVAHSKTKDSAPDPVDADGLDSGS